MKRFKRFLMSTALALSFTVTMPTDARADPITAAIVTFVGLTGTAAAVATFVINSALYAAASFATSKLLMKKQGLQERQASVTTLSLGETPREAVLGETVTAGWLIDAFNFGGQYGTNTVTRCVGLADHEIDAIVGFYVGEKYYPWVGPGQQAAFSNKLSFHFRNASDIGYDPPLHVATNGGWTNADRLCGITHIWIDTLGDDKVWTQGHPQFRFVLRGLKAYDPRKDAALGYTGPNPHVWADRATHEFTRNAMVLRYAFQRGIYAEGHQGDPSYLLIGRGLSEEEAPPERIIAAANLCDEIVNGAPRYRADGVIRASDDFIAVEEMFAAATAGVIIQHEGGVEVEPGQAKAAVITISDGDLVVGEAVRFSDFLPDLDGGRINSVVPSFTDPVQNWAVRSGPVRRDVADIQADGGPRELTLPLALVTSANQADRCAEIARRMARLERRASIVLPPEYAGLEEGDWIAWQSARYHDGATVRYRIEGWSLDAMWRMRLQLREIAASCFGVVSPLPDLISPPGSPFALDALALNGVQVQAEALTAGGAGVGATIPALVFSWTIPVDPAVIAIRAEVRVVGSTIVASTRTEDVNRPSAEDPGRASMRVTNGVPSGAEVEARLIPITSSTRNIFDAAWTTVTTPALTALSVGDSAALARLAIIDSDGWLSRGEKPEVVRQWTAIVAEFPGIRDQALAAGATAQRTALITAYDNLAAYLAGLSPAFDDTTTDTAVTPTAFAGQFSAYFTARANAQAAILSLLDADVQAAISRLDVIDDDEILSRGEKPEVIRQWTVIQGEIDGLLAQALSVGVTTERTALSDRYGDLAAYIGGLSPPLTNTDTDTAINSLFASRFANYYVARQALANAMVGLVDADVNTALSRLDVIASDNWLSAGEKPAVIREVEVINGEAVPIRDVAFALGITTERVTFENAFNALNSYLAGLSPAWNNLSSDTPIVSASFRAVFVNYYVARSILQAKTASTTGSAVFRVESSHAGRVGLRTGAGSVTTPLITLTAYGNTGTMSYSWERILGDGSVTATAPTGAASAATGTVASGEEKQALFAWRATDSGTGITREGQVSFTLISNV